MQSTWFALSGRINWTTWILHWGACLLLAIPLCYAQGGRGTISGTVTDETGAVVPDATVEVTSLDTQQSRQLLTTDVGTYVAPFLPVGNYSVSVSKSGFRSEKRTGIILTTDQAATVNIVLAVGEARQSVEVSANAQMVETTSGAIGQMVSSQAVVELPLNGRNPSDLAIQAPGAVDGTRTATIKGVQAGMTMPQETGASVNGSRIGGVYYMLDGIQNMDYNDQHAAAFPNADATQEFRVITNNFDAQYGFAANAVVSVVTKSGTNQWHGDLFEFVRNDGLDAADFFSHKTDGLKRNQFGGSIGGPIRRDKDFIFGNIQITQERQAQFSTSAFVPSNQMLNGDFSAITTQ
jgi:hypothetical protein